MNPFDPMHEVIRALCFGGETIGARPRKDSNGHARDREAGWVAFWPADAAEWVVEVARPLDDMHENHIYVRFQLDGVVQTWPWTTTVKLLDEGWIEVPHEWDANTSDLRPSVEDVLSRLESVDSARVENLRAVL